VNLPKETVTVLSLNDYKASESSTNWHKTLENQRRLDLAETVGFEPTNALTTLLP